MTIEDTGPRRQLTELLSQIGHWRWDARTERLEWSDEVFRIHGYPPGAFQPTIAKGIAAYHPDDRERAEKSLQEALAEGEGFSFQLRIVRADDRVREVVASGFCHSEGGSVVEVFGTFHDITDILGNQERAHTDRERLRLATRAARLGVWDLDVVRDKLIWDENMYVMYGVPPDRFSGAYSAWATVLHPEDAERAQTAVQAALEGPNDLDTRFRIIRPLDGSTRTIEAHGAVVRDHRGAPLRLLGINEDITERVEAEERFRRAVRGLPVGCFLLDAHGRILFANESVGVMLGADPMGLVGRRAQEILPEADYLIDPDDRSASSELARKDVVAQRPDGTRIWVQLGVSSFSSDPGDEVRILSLTDLSEQKELQSKLAHSQRMEAVGLLAGGIAHDFNNLLSVLAGHVGFLEESIAAEDEEGQESLRALKKLGCRGSALTRRLLAYSRRQELSPERTDVGRICRELELMLRRTLPESIQLVSEVARHLHIVEVDPHQLEDAVVNLCVNAQQAMNGSGRLLLRVRNVDVEAKSLESTVPSEAGPYVEIAVVDDGPGMTPEVLERAFDPFFTTKEVGHGTGLGLSMVYGFVTQSKGHVFVDSQVGQGTSVRIYLPAAALAQIKPSAPCILLVEDDDDVRSIPARILRRRGYEVLEATNGDEAKPYLEGDTPLALLFTDVTLPGRASGVDLLRIAQRTRPGLPVLLATGYAGDVLEDLELEGVPVLHKPYARQELLDQVTRLLGPAPRLSARKSPYAG